MLAMAELFYSSCKCFYRDYKKWKRDKKGTTSLQRGRKALVTDSQLKQAVEAAKKLTKELGGMPFKKFMEFLEPFVRNSQRESGTAPAFPEQFPLSSFATKETFLNYYRYILPRYVRKGDRALQQRMNVRNDILAWTSQHVMTHVALQGTDGALFPVSRDKAVPQAFSIFNVDAFAVRAEGGEFDKCQGRTTEEAVEDCQESYHGMKILTEDSILYVGEVHQSETDANYMKWVAKLRKVDDNDTDDDADAKFGSIELDQHSQQVHYTQLGRTHQDGEEVSYADTDSFNPIPLHDMSDDDDTDANEVQQTPKRKWLPHISAICQPPGTGQPATKFPAMQCRGLKWEVITNSEYPGMVGAVCIVKEKKMECEKDFIPFLMYPRENIWFVVRKVRIDENAFADWKLTNVILSGITSVMGATITAAGSDVHGDDDVLQRYVLTQDGCGLDLNAVVRYIDSGDGMENLEVVKLFAKGTAIFQAHDVGKSHPTFNACVANDDKVILTTEAALLPSTHSELWTFLDTCNMDPPTKRTIYKHMVNANYWLGKAFSRYQMRSAYKKCGLFPLNFRTFMQRMPAWKDITEEDILHVESKLPELILLGMKQGAILCSDVLKAVGPEWLLIWETNSLSPQAREALVQERLSYTPDETSPLNRQGTIILTNEQAKKRRIDAAEAKLRAQEEKEKQEEIDRKRRAEDEASLRAQAVAVRHVYFDASPDDNLEAFTIPDLKALITTYWEDYVHVFHVVLPSTWNGKSINKWSSMNREGIVEYALIILKHHSELPSIHNDITDERVADHVQKLSSKIETKQRNKLAAECGTARKGNKRKTQDDAEAMDIEGASIIERVRYESMSGRVSMRRLY
jgi:hypothetical protein